uniref:Non-ribosomal peptide synthetase n=1 Tax=uncultured bacterium AB_9 TaxID=1630012 RepID=A0A0E3JRK6_9BACT|nr:non-ribosomal peptide synthetase [uncultured bacterium AB_9]
MSESQYVVVAGRSGELSMWPAARPVPGGWSVISSAGSAETCLAQIERQAPPLIGPARPPAGGEEADDSPSILHFFADAVARHPARPAVSGPGGTLTYAQLDAASTRAAQQLALRGVAGEDRVAVHLGRGADVFVAILGVLKAGGAYVPIDARLNAARRDLMIENSGATVLITEPAVSASLTLPDVTALTPEDLQVPVAQQRTLPAVTGERAACVLFTSGSTGTPKAIVLEHRNIAYFALNRSLPALLPTDRVAHVSSLSFDAFHFELWCTLAAGAEIVVLPVVPDLVAADVQRELRRHRITAMLAPTMAVNHIVQDDRDAFASLRILHTGGDVIRPSAAGDLVAGAFAGEFHNLYGPTECATACTGHRIETVAPDGESVPIGRPLDGAAVYLLDEDGHPVPDGTVGEIHVGGAGVARGYLGLPRETATCFLPDPAGPDGARMYRTGDLARRRPDGALEFVSRTDDQVKIRGYRVELGEVERALCRHPAVLDAAVLAEGEGDSRYLVAVLAGAGTVPLRAVRGHLAETLPDYLVPAALVAVDRLPASEHGKRDVDRLRRIARAEMNRRRTIVAPRDQVEQRLAEAWQELLAIEDVGIHDDFFALGGNSMLAFRLRRRLGKETGVELDMHEVLSTTVLADFADLLRRRMVVTGG